MSLDFVAVDFETANQFRESICSVGLIKVIDGKIVDEYYSLINPEDYFDPFNVGLHGITEKMVENAPVYPEIRSKMIDFIGELPVVAHYAPFDTGAIRDANLKYDLDHFEMKYFCSYALSRSLLIMLSYKLINVAKELEIEFEHHNALEDAKACASIVLRLSNKYNLLTVEELAAKAGYKKLGYIDRNEWKGFIKTQNNKYTDILKQLNYPNIEELDQDHEFYGKYVVFTGTLSSMPRKAAMQEIVNIGGIPQKGISKETNFLIMGEQDLAKLNGQTKSSKMRKAESLLKEGQDIQLLGEYDFLKMFNWRD